MKVRGVGFAAVSILAGLTLVLFAAKPAASQSQAAKSAAGKPTPRTVNGHPDFDGLWDDSATGDLNGGYGGRQFEKASDGSILFDFSTEFGHDNGCVGDACQVANQPPYKPEYMAKVKEIAANFYGISNPADPDMQCKPRGVPRGAVGGAMRFVQTPKVIAILYEGHPQPSSVYRIIYMDSPHPDDLDTTYLGDSRGHWEGDTLVVDVTGLNDETWLGGGVRPGGNSGSEKYATIHSEKEHVIERWTRNGDVITYAATVEDPVMFTRPWVITPIHIHLDTTPGDQLLELFCTPEATGGAHFIKPTEQERNKVCEYRSEANCDK